MLMFYALQWYGSHPANLPHAVDRGVIVLLASHKVLLILRVHIAIKFSQLP
jgi:hypothetical protein